MAYRCELSPDQVLYLSQQGNQTLVVLSTLRPGQQQQSSSSFSTGGWTAEPEVFCTPLHIMVRLHTDAGDRHLQIQGGSIQLVHTRTPVREDQRLPVTATDQFPNMEIPPMRMEPMRMEPMRMEPMRMEPMQMSPIGMNPMEMRMGNMSMSMGNSSATPQNVSGASSGASSKAASGHSAAAGVPQSTGQVRRFCSQCGQPVEPGDRFCASCGHALTH